MVPKGWRDVMEVVNRGGHKWSDILKSMSRAWRTE
jgi:hypothetical protein